MVGCLDLSSNKCMESQEQLDPSVVALAKAIGKKESNGNYNAVGDNGHSAGAYQWNNDTPLQQGQIPKNFIQFAQEVGADPSDFSPRNQDMVAYKTIQKWGKEGLTPAQIASRWNSGDPNAYTRNSSGYNKKQGVSYDVNQYVDEVGRNFNQYLESFKSNGYKLNPPPKQTPEDIQKSKEELQSQGEGVSLRDDRVKPTFVGGLIRGIIKPTATLLARPIQLAEVLAGKSPEETTIKSKYLGDIKAPQSKDDVIKDIGRAAETISLGIGGGEVGNLIAQGGKKTVAQLVKQGVIQGSKAGALGTGGSAIEEGKSGKDLASQIAIGGALGGLTGGLVEGISPLVRKGGSLLGDLSKATGISDISEQEARDAIVKTAQEYDRAAGTGLKNSFRNRQATRSGELRPWSETLAEYGIVPQEGPNKTWDLEKAFDDIDSINEEFGKVKDKFRKNENALFNIDEALRGADEDINNTLKSEIARNKAKDKIRKEVEAVLGKKEVMKNQQGERLLNASDMERLRDVGYELTPFNASDPQKIGESAGYALARNINSTIDKYATFPSYRAFNREWSNILNAKEALNQLKTKNIRLSKGLSGQIALKVLGPVLGYSRGGIIGGIFGDLGAETAGRLLSDPQLRTLVQRSIIKKAQLKLPKDKIISSLEKEIDDYIARRQTQLVLPEGVL